MNIGRTKKKEELPQGVEELSDYIVVTRPRNWIVICLILSLLLIFLAWAVFGTITVTVQSRGIARNGIVMTYLKAEQLTLVNGKSTISIYDNETNSAGTFSRINNIPDSAAEQRKRLNDDTYSLYILNEEEEPWLYYCEIRPEEEIADGPVNIILETEPRHPISYVIQ